MAMLASPFRADFSREYGDLMFVNAEIELKTFSPEIIPQLQQENDLTQEYEKLLASAQIPFEGRVYTLSQLTPFKTTGRRPTPGGLEGGGTVVQGQPGELDAIYDQLVHLRDEMGRKLGYEGYTTLGYYRMGRNCYTKEDVERFRAAVVKYLVPVADQVYRAQAQRLGKTYPMSFADNALEFRSGNPRPVGTPDDILAQGKKFYDELSPETSEFFRTMLEGELLDVLSTEGKQSGGYCTSIADYEVPFIFATSTAPSTTWRWSPTRRARLRRLDQPQAGAHGVCLAVHGGAARSTPCPWSSLAEPWADGFFGPDAKKFLYSHLSGALTFIPYGTMVDHFQHEVYAHPDMTPAQRHAVWKELLGVYMPGCAWTGTSPSTARARAWQRQHHIYSSPFYLSTTAWPRPCPSSSGRGSRRTKRTPGSTIWPIPARGAAGCSPSF